MVDHEGIRTTLMVGIWPPKVRTTAICSMSRNVSRMLLAPKSLKLSAQSPPCRRNARPMAASPSRSSSFRTSPANTSGGEAASARSLASSAARSGYSGICRAGRARQLPGAHSPGPAAAARAIVGPRRRGLVRGTGERGAMAGAGGALGRDAIVAVAVAMEWRSNRGSEAASRRD